MHCNWPCSSSHACVITFSPPSLYPSFSDFIRSSFLSFSSISLSLIYCILPSPFLLCFRFFFSFSFFSSVPSSFIPICLPYCLLSFLSSPSLFIWFVPFLLPSSSTPLLLSPFFLRSFLLSFLLSLVWDPTWYRVWVSMSFFILSYYGFTFGLLVSFCLSFFFVIFLLLSICPHLFVFLSFFPISLIWEKQVKEKRMEEDDRGKKQNYFSLSLPSNQFSLSILNFCFARNEMPK